MASKNCPYYKYGQCTVAPKSIATTVVEAKRCKKDWRSCRYYTRNARVERIKSPPKNNGTLEDYMLSVETRGDLEVKTCNFLYEGYCKVRGEKLSPTELVGCIKNWKNCPLRFKNREEFESKLASILESFSNEKL